MSDTKEDNVIGEDTAVVGEMLGEPVPNNHENWMSELTPQLQTKPLNQLAIPGYDFMNRYLLGTHDSFTYSLDKSGPVANDESGTLQSLGSLPCVKNIIYNWYFDFRLSHPTKASSADEVKVLHGLYGASVWDIIKDIKSFLDTHPREVLLLDWNHFYNFSAELHQTVIDQLQNTFGAKLCPRSTAADLSLQFMWSKGYQVVLFYQVDNMDPPPVFWTKLDISSPWANTDSRQQLLDFLATQLKQRSLAEFYVVQGIETPEAKDVASHLSGSLEDSLASDCTKAVAQWLQTNKTLFKPLLNVVFCDFVNKFDMIEIVLGYNN